MLILLALVATIIIAWQASADRAESANIWPAATVFAVIAALSLGMTLSSWQYLAASGSSPIMQIAGVLLPIVVAALPASAAFLAGRWVAKMQVRRRAARFAVALGAGLLVNPIVLYIGACGMTSGCS
mgnify:CR=1 FL=1